MTFSMSKLQSNIRHSYSTQTPEHVLMSCPLTEQLRRSTWLKYTVLEKKLWGTKEELHCTASFIEETNINV